MSEKPTYDALETRVAELERQTGTYRSIIETAMDGFWITDTSARILKVNDSYCSMIGYSKPELLSMRISDVEALEDADLVAGHMKKLVQKGTDRFETRHRRKDGTIIDVEVSVQHLPEEGGRVVCFLRDITERKEAEKTLIESEQKWRNILINTPQMGISLTPKAEIIFVNAHFLKLTGWGWNDVIGQDWFDMFIPGDVRKNVREVFHEVMTQKATHGFSNYVNEIRTKDGSRLNISWSNVLTKDTNGNIVDVTCLGVDLTERIRAEKSLKTSHERFLTVLDSIDATIYVADMETYEILFMNKHMVDTFGNDFTGEICWKSFRGESGPCSVCSNDQLLDENGVPAGMHTWHDKNPVTGKWYINHDRAIYWVDGRLVRLQVATDITQLKLLEEKIREAQKMESIGNLAGGIAHDFNNILFPIIGMSEMLMEDLPPGSQEQENAEEILKAGQRGSDLIKQILAFSRQSEHQLIPIRVQSVLKEALKLTRSSIPSDIEIDQYIQKDCGLILADPTQIHQVAMNIITNAYHAVETNSGKIRVMLTTTALKADQLPDPTIQPGRYVVLTISDTGCGIPESQREKIFDPYFTTKKRGKGTGLGLAVVQGIVKEHGGTIRVVSEIGIGTTFEVFLPLLEKTEKAKPIHIADTYPSGTERILLVDDEEPIIKVDRQIFERLGYKVTTRLSSIDALNMFKANPHSFDLVISDLTMPNMTGDQLALELMAVRPDIPIIICTGFSERINQEMADAIGIKGLLMKPIIKAEMAKMVRKVLDEAKG